MNRKWFGIVGATAISTLVAAAVYAAEPGGTRDSGRSGPMMGLMGQGMMHGGPMMGMMGRDMVSGGPMMGTMLQDGRMERMMELCQQTMQSWMQPEVAPPTTLDGTPPAPKNGG